MTIRNKLIACLAVIAVVIIALAAKSISALDASQARIRTIVADRVIPMKQLKVVADRYAVDIVDTAHKVRAGSLTWEDGTNGFGKAIKDIDTQWGAYRATYLTDDESRLADSFESVRTGSQSKLAELRAIFDAKDMKRLTAFVEQDLYPAIDPLGGAISALIDLQIAVAEQEYAAAEAESSLALAFDLALSLTVILAIATSIWIIIKGVSQPINRLSAVMRRIAGGELDLDVYGDGRKDEIGSMADAVKVFRDGGREKLRLEAESVLSRQRIESDRTKANTEKEKAQAATEAAVLSVAEALSRLAQGDLTHRIDHEMPAELDRLRKDFNGAAEQLQATLSSISVNTRAIASGSGEMRSAAGDLAIRTERQAASVEETAAALEEITTTVADASRRAEEAGRLVSKTKANAERSGEVVRSAMAAMGEIEGSAKQISNIIGVIDEIAFQTNLLALNAGVEAARAGEAGKGFAVVAQEVRELAQRSASAAKEIKLQINTSGEQVKNGVQLVSQTGDVLQEIVVQVQEINANVVAIVEAAKEQTIGLKEINSAVNLIDQGTQQNAAMVEETNAASSGLASEAEALFALLAKFKLGSGDTKPLFKIVNEGRASGVQHASPAHTLQARAAMAVRGTVSMNGRNWQEL